MTTILLRLPSKQGFIYPKPLLHTMAQDWFKLAQMAGIRKGSIIRSYDFMHTNDTYILGEVVEIGPVEGSKGHLAVHIKGIKQVMDGSETPLYGQMYYPFLMHMQDRQFGDQNLGPGIVLARQPLPPICLNYPN
jgi:hypothetical protein